MSMIRVMAFVMCPIASGALAAVPVFIGVQAQMSPLFATVIALLMCVGVGGAAWLWFD